MKVSQESDTKQIFGLVLAGGQSSRMGRDKGKIEFNNIPLRLHIYNILRPLVAQCFMSGRPDQISEFEELPFLPDKIIDHGPFGAILTAFDHNPDVAWLVVGCDYPLITQGTFEQLITNRGASSLATVFSTQDNNYPSPLPALWESGAYQILTSSFEAGNDSMMKVLRSGHPTILTPSDSKWLFNMNTLQDAYKANLL